MDWLRLSLVIPQGFKPWTFRTGICHSISLSIPLFMGIFGIPQKRICADSALLILSCHKFGRLYFQFGKFSIKSSLFWIKILSLLYLSTDLWKNVLLNYGFVHLGFLTNADRGRYHVWFIHFCQMAYSTDCRCQSELRIERRRDKGSTSVHSYGNLQQIPLAKGQ